MANNVLEEKFPFLQEGVFLIAQVNAMTGQQRLLMQKVDPRTGQVLIKDAINCIHVAVGNIPTEEFEATADAADFPEDVLRIRSSEKLKEISLAPEEKFQAFKSWVSGIAEAGLDAFKLQRDIEVAGKLAYPIVNRIMTFAVKVDPTLLTEHIENIVRECQHEGTHHVASLTANILPIVQLAQKHHYDWILEVILDLALPFPVYLNILKSDQRTVNFFLKSARHNEPFLDELQAYAEQNSGDENGARELETLSYMDVGARAREILLKFGVPCLPDYSGMPLFPPEYAVLEELEELLGKPVPKEGGTRLKHGFQGEGGHVLKLDLSNQDLKSLPETLGNLQSLQVLKLEDNHLTILPASVGDLKSLQRLFLQENKLSALPQVIGNLPSLQLLDLRFNKLVFLPETLGNLQSLQVLKLEGNQLTTLPASVGNLRSLQRINLRRNMLSALPQGTGNLPSLQLLDLSYNKLDFLPETLGNLQSLRVLKLEGNQLTVLPASVGNLRSLQGLNLNCNKLSVLPETLGNLQSLQILKLEGNQLTALPTSVGNLNSLQSLDLKKNMLTSLPESIGNLQSLQSLELTGNQLTSLPESIGYLQSLQSLELTGNQLTSLPESIGNLQSLQSLELTGNQLTSLPESIGNLHTLQYLYLYGNKSILLPESIVQLSSLKELRLS